MCQSRCCALYMVCAELTYHAIMLFFLLSGIGRKSFSEPKSRSSSELAVAQEKNFGIVTILIVSSIGIIPNILVLVGILKNSEPMLKWGIYIKSVFTSLTVIALILLIILCVAVINQIPDSPGPGVCMFLLISAIPLACPIRALRAYDYCYAEITGGGLLPCCCTEKMAPGMIMMGSGNVVMYSPSGQPIYAPVGSEGQPQPSYGQMSPSQQQMWMQQQQQMMN